MRLICMALGAARTRGTHATTVLKPQGMSRRTLRIRAIRLWTCRREKAACSRARHALSKQCLRVGRCADGRWHGMAWHAGKGEAPSTGDMVLVEVKGVLANGTVFLDTK